MPTYAIYLDNGYTSLEDVTEVTASYYKHEEDWVTFKSGDHKVVADFPAREIRKILVTTPTVPYCETHSMHHNAPGEHSQMSAADSELEADRRNPEPGPFTGSGWTRVKD